MYEEDAVSSAVFTHSQRRNVHQLDDEWEASHLYSYIKPIT